MAQEKIDRLAQENAAALAAGMSYGKWKAKQSLQQIVAPAVAEEEKPKYRHVCEYCGEEFFIKSKRLQKYCCEECQRQAKRQRERERHNVPNQRVCERCGKEFIINTKRKQKYCCEECRQQAFHQQARERRAQAKASRNMQAQG